VSAGTALTTDGELRSTGVLTTIFVAVAVGALLTIADLDSLDFATAGVVSLLHLFLVPLLGVGLIWSAKKPLAGACLLLAAPPPPRQLLRLRRSWPLRGGRQGSS
jgi:hypothetical protein